MSESPPAQKVTDDDLIEAIKERCNQSGIPVVPTKEVEKVDYITIKKQAIARRLKTLAEQEQISSLKIGRGWVWWVPEENESGGEVDFSTINWSSIDPAEIPTEKIYKHPELADSTYWDQLYDDAYAISRAGLWSFTPGLVILFVDQNVEIVSLTQFQEEVGAVALLGGILLLSMGIIAISISKIGSGMSEKGIDGWMQAKYRSWKSRILAGVPIKISWEWKNKSQKREE